MNFKPAFSSATVQTAYMEVRDSFTTSFLKVELPYFPSFLISIAQVLTIIATGSILFTLFQWRWPEGIASLFKMFALLLASLILWRYGHRLGRFRNMTVSAISLGLLVNEVFNLRELLLDLEVDGAFHAGYVLGIFERIIIQQISYLEFKVIFLAASATTRLLVIPLDNGNVMFYHWIWWLINLLTEILREKDIRLLFKTYHESKEELLKFKDLMVSSMPTNVLILSQDLKKMLFCNEYFQTTFNLPKNFAEMQWNVDDWLSGFFIEHGSLNGTSRDALGDDMSTTKSLNMSQVFQKLIDKHLLNDHTHQFCFNVRSQDSGSYESEYVNRKIFETQVFSLPWDGKIAVAVILNDVTQQFMNLALKVAASNKDKLIAMVSHELRTPLNCILGMITIMEKQIVDSEIVNYLTVCKNNAKLLLSLVNSILDLGQIRNNKFKLAISKGNVQEILQEIHLLFEVQFKAKGLYLKTDITPDVDQWIISDLNRLRQVLINLVGNALKFTSEGGVSVLVTNHQTREGYLNVRVSDTGIGIKEEDKKKLFKMYGRLEHSDTGINSEGIGLGLTISNHLVRLLADNEEDDGIQVESEYGQGSTFSFSIKATLNKEVQIGAEYDLGHTEGREHSQTLNDSQEFVNKVSNYMINATNFFLTSPFNTNRRLLHPPLRKNPSYRIRFSTSSSRSVKLDQELFSFQSPSSFRNAHEDLKFSKGLKKGKVLLVDDSPFNLMVAKHLVEGLGYQVQTALNGEAAIGIVKKSASKGERFSIILMDCQMPIMNGYETTKILCKMMSNGEIPNVPIVALSANDAERDKELCKEAGMIDHLAKPLNEDKLQEIMKKFCRRK